MNAAQIIIGLITHGIAAVIPWAIAARKHARTEALLFDIQDRQITWSRCPQCAAIVACTGTPCVVGHCETCGYNVLESELEIVDPAAEHARLLGIVRIQMTTIIDLAKIPNRIRPHVQALRDELARPRSWGTIQKIAAKLHEAVDSGLPDDPQRMQAAIEKAAKRRATTKAALANARAAAEKINDPDDPPPPIDGLEHFQPVWTTKEPKL